MKVIYLDEYEEELLEIDSPFIPRVGDVVHIGSPERYVVTEVVWNADSFIGYVLLRSEDEAGLPIKEKSVDHTGRINQLNNAIIEATKRLGDVEKKHKRLTEELVTVRQHIKRNTPKKETPQ